MTTSPCCAGCVTMATTPYSPSSGYWSANEDEASNVSTFDPALSPSTWLLRPHHHSQLRPRVTSEEEEEEDEEDEEERDADQLLMTFHSEIESKLKSPPEIKQELELGEADEGERPDTGDPEFGPEMDISLPTGSNSLTDFLFCDFLEGSYHPDRIPDDIDDDVILPVDENRLLSGLSFDGEFRDSSTDLYDMWKDCGGGELQLEEIREPLSRCDANRLFTSDDPLEELRGSVQGTSGPFNRLSSSPINRLCDLDELEVDLCSISGCASPVMDVASLSSSVSSLDADDYLDCLLFDALSRPPSAPPDDDVIPEVETLKLILVAASGATKRKSSETDRLPRKLLHINLPSNRKEEDKLTSGDDHAVSAVTSPVECSTERQEDGPSQLEKFGKIEEDWTKEELNPSELRDESSFSRLASAADKNNKMAADGACAARIAEVLATMLKADGVLREPNRGSDAIFEELKNLEDPPTPSPSSSSSSSGGQRGATSLRSFLIQRRRQTQGGQTLLQRLLKGQTTEAEIRREMAVKEQGQ